MAIYKEDIVDIELQTGTIHRSFLNHTIGTGDDMANRFGVRLFRNGEPVSVETCVVGGIFIAPSGVKYAINETSYQGSTGKSGNVAWIQLPEICYAAEGNFSLAVKLSGGGISGTMRIVDGQVSNTGEAGAVVPTSTIPTTQEIIEAFEEAMAVIDSSVRFDGAQSLSSSEQAQARENIAAASGKEVSDLKKSTIAETSGLGMLNILSYGNKETVTKAGTLKIEFDKGVYHITGTMSENETAPFYNITSDIMDMVVPGMHWFGLYQIQANTNAKILLSDYYKTTGDWTLGYQVTNGDGCKWNIASNITDILVRMDFYAGVEYDHYVVPVLSRNHIDILSDIVAEDYKTLVANNKLFNPEDDILQAYKKEKVFYYTNGIKFFPRDGIFYVSGTATSNAFYNILFSSSAIPEGITAGKSYLAIIHNNNTESAKVFLDCWYYDANGSAVQFRENTQSFIFNVPEDATGIVVRLIVKNGTTFTKEEGISFGLYPIDTAPHDGAILYGGDIHEIRRSGLYFGSRPGTYTNCPVNDAFMLVNYEINNNIQYQLIYDWTGADIYVSKRFNTTWTAWQHISAGGEITNNYTYNNYENTYNIECSPTIGTDTNNFLASTGDTTDRTGAIQTMLNTTGFCQLGPGVFYVTGVEVPNNGMLRGCGNSTKLVLASSVTDGYAVKLKTYGCVKDMLIAGLEEDSNTTPTSVGTRHGILFEDSADSRTGNTGDYFRSAVENCMIRNFTGGGITMYNTGYNVANDLIISDCFIFRCGVGLNISYFSEFHRITNVTCQYCLYGCIDNGGNNNFACCDFSGNYTGLLIDNSSGQSRNNSHGSFVGCTIHHSFGSGGTPNAGTAIRILGAESGEVFTALQVSNGAIVIDDSYGIRFIGANIGNNLPITITDSVVVTFSECSFMNSTGSALTQSGNTRLEFRNCYLNNGSEYNPLA